MNTDIGTTDICDRNAANMSYSRDRQTADSKKETKKERKTDKQTEMKERKKERKKEMKACADALRGHLVKMSSLTLI